jgi:hypothetical protein
MMRSEENAHKIKNSNIFPQSLYDGTLIISHFSSSLFL